MPKFRESEVQRAWTTSLLYRLLNQEIRCAQNQGLSVLYCIGESSEEQPEWEKVLGEQLDTGLDGVLYSMPVSDVLNFILTLIVIVKTYKEVDAPSQPVAAAEKAG